MKKYISLFLIIGQIACFQQVPSSSSSPPSSSGASSSPTSDAGVNLTDAFSVPIPPLPEPQELHLQPPPDAGALIQPLSLNQRAGFNGVLFNAPALAYLQTEYVGVQQQCRIDDRRVMENVMAQYQQELSLVQESLLASNQNHQIETNGYTREIQNLNQVITQQQRNSSSLNLTQGALWAGGGFLLGLVVVAGIVYLAKVP